MKDDSRAINPYEAPHHGNKRAPRRFSMPLTTTCMFVSLICLVTTWIGIDLLYSVGLYDRMGDGGRPAYNATKLVTHTTAFVGVMATIIAIALGSRFERTVMLIVAIPYAPIVLGILMRLREVMLR